MSPVLPSSVAFAASSPLVVGSPIVPTACGPVLNLYALAYAAARMTVEADVRRAQARHLAECN